jgi:hypothetical protein
LGTWTEDSTWEEADYDDYKMKLKEVLISQKSNEIDLNKFSKSFILDEYYREILDFTFSNLSNRIVR